MTEICLLALIGIPGSGKTTLSQALLENSKNISVVHVCFDDFLKNHINEDFKQNFKKQRQEILSKIEQCIVLLKDNFTVLDEFKERSMLKDISKVFLIIDDNNFYRSMRYEIFKIARKYSISFAQIYLNVELVECLERNSQRNICIPERIIQEMHYRMEAPLRNNKWEKNSLSFPSLNLKNDLDTIFDFLDQCFLHPEKPPVTEQTLLVVQSEVHRLDLLLRKQINVIVNNCTGQQKTSATKQSKASQLNMKRKNILADFRIGILDVDFDDVASIENLLC